jgi:hypothetical protein
MKALRTTVVLAALVTFASVLPASASIPAWAAAKLATLPVGAQGIPDGFLPTLTCVSIGNCEAGGAYTDSHGDVEGLVLNEAKGVWTAPQTLKAPANAAANPGVTIYALSCGALNNCAAAGSYQDRADNVLAFVANEVAGHWLPAKQVTLPTNALAKGQNALLRSIQCSSSGECSAVGTYDDNNSITSRTEGFVVSETHGTWARAREVVAPNPNFNPFLSLNQIACASVGDCVAVGSFINANDVTEGLVVDQVGGAWTHGRTLALPSNASAFAGATLSEVACVHRSDCAVFGTYNTTTGAVEALSARSLNGVWSQAVQVTLPANAGLNPHVFLYGFDGIACATSGNCAAGGQYEDASGDFQGFLANETAGTWQSATELALPGGAKQAGKNGGVVALACPAVGECRASGAYVDASGNYQAVVVTEQGGSWQTGVKVVLPGNATTVGVDGGIYSLICLTTSSCVGTGSYLKSASTYDGFTLAS